MKKCLLSCLQQQLDASKEDINPHIHWGRRRKVILFYPRAKYKNKERRVPLKLFPMQCYQNWVWELVTSGLSVHLVLAEFYTKLTTLLKSHWFKNTSGMLCESRHKPNFFHDRLGHFWLQVGTLLLSVRCWTPVHQKNKRGVAKHFRQHFCPGRMV